jgi:hypothetical protein
MGLNRYAYANGNPVNLADPSGHTAVDIWAAAFIMPEFIRFPFGADPVAIFEGDNRSWHTLQDFNDPVPLSSRIWWSIHFDTDDLSTVVSQSGRGETVAVYAGVGIGNIYVTRGAVPIPEPGSVACVGLFGDINVEIEAGISGKNPLSVLSPPIVLHYSIFFRPSLGRVDVYRNITRFPWHELQITADGGLTVQMQQEPLGPTFTPADLALPALSTVVINPFPQGKGCNSFSSLLRNVTCLPLQLA